MERETFNDGLLEFLGAATSPFHAVAELARRLREAGFEPLNEADAWSVEPGGRHYLTRNDSSIIAFKAGTESPPQEALRMVGAHTDSPCLMVKPNPERRSHGYQQLGVEVYGGALLNPWFDRDLSLAGRVTWLDPAGELRKGLVDFREPLAVIPSLAIHLDREANRKRSVNPQKDIPPVLGTFEKMDIREALAAQVHREHPKADVDRVLDYELCCYDTQPPRLVGLEREFIASARLDNLLSCYVGLRAIVDSPDAVSSLLVCNDHEEVGSMSAAGAQGPMLRDTLERIAGDRAAYLAMLDSSVLISADNAHGVHPNFADRHDENHGPLINAGPVIKINASQRYATNSETAALFRQMCADVDVPVQSFVVRTDMACGSTIGPLTAGGVGVRTLDVGAPQFAMHSIRELAGAWDAWHLWRVLRRFMDWRGALNPRAV